MLYDLWYIFMYFVFFILFFVCIMIFLQEIRWLLWRFSVWVKGKNLWRFTLILFSIYSVFNIFDEIGRSIFRLSAIIRNVRLISLCMLTQTLVSWFVEFIKRFYFGVSMTLQLTTTTTTKNITFHPSPLKIIFEYNYRHRKERDREK